MIALHQMLLCYLSTSICLFFYGADLASCNQIEGKCAPVEGDMANERPNLQVHKRTRE